MNAALDQKAASAQAQPVTPPFARRLPERPVPWERDRGPVKTVRFDVVPPKRDRLTVRMPIVLPPVLLGYGRRERRPYLVYLGVSSGKFSY